MLDKILAQLGSFWLTYLLMFAYALACAVATFIENDYGTESAKMVVYSSQWFAFLHIFLIINLVIIVFKFKMIERKRYSVLLLHMSFIVILIGAGITRYAGFEGLLHIREGESSSIMQSSENFLILRALKGDVSGDHYIVYQDFPISVSYLYSKPFYYPAQLKDDTLYLAYEDYVRSANPKDKNSELQVKVTYQNHEQSVRLKEGQPVRFALGDLKVMLDWGSRDIELPFFVYLEDFELERYPGSRAPSSYSSRVKILDESNGVTMPYHIYMNHTLDYGGYRFFQSSYDQDELGTILSVNRDPGKIPTYIGYFMLIVAFVWIMFDPKGRFKKLSRFVKAQNATNALLLLSLLAFSSPSLYANQSTPEMPSAHEIESMDINQLREHVALITKALVHGIQANTKDHANLFARLLVQDFGGRVKPIDTLASDFVHKITKKDSFLGMSNIQLFLGMTAYPEEWKSIKMIYIGTPALKKILGLKPSEKYASFYDLYQNGYYKLYNLLTEVNLKKPAERGTLDKDIINVNERFEAMYQILSANALKILPDPSGQTQKWHSPIDLDDFTPSDASHAMNLIRQYFQAFDALVAGNGSEQQANVALEALMQYQQEYGSALFPSPNRISAEIFLNRSNIFQTLCYCYLIFGIVLFVVSLIRILRQTPHERAQKLYAWLDSISLWGITLILMINTFALGLRWYVSGHAPWSNAYESMIYIAWASGLCGPVLLRDSKLAFSASAIMAGICLFVAHLGFMDPQIGNLVPVLKSYWLNIHVSIITASYGFLGLCFILGVVTLLLFLLRSSSREKLDHSIQTLSAINEMSMITGLAMLSVGTFLGGIWANESWGRYWGWDSKETWSLISMIVYAIILHVRFVRAGNRPYIFASLSVIGFYSILMTYFGVNFYLSGMHSYAAGDPLPIPSFLYYLTGGIAALIIGAGFKSNLKSGV